MQGRSGGGGGLIGTGGGALGMMSLNQAGKQHARTGQHKPVASRLRLGVCGLFNCVAGSILSPKLDDDMASLGPSAAPQMSSAQYKGDRVPRSTDWGIGELWCSWQALLDIGVEVWDLGCLHRPGVTDIGLIVCAGQAVDTDSSPTIKWMLTWIPPTPKTTIHQYHAETYN